MNIFIIWLVVIVIGIISYCLIKSKKESKKKAVKYRRLLIATILGSLILFAVNYQSMDDYNSELLKDIPIDDINLKKIGGVSDILINLDEF
jgi:heme/copper-type cytochrome/quinol oxidase subunit 2